MWPYIEFELGRAQVESRRFIMEIGDRRLIIW